MKSDATRGQLETLILGVLSGTPLHGYAIIEALRERSGGRFDLPEGTVYPALHRLEAAGVIASEWTPGSGRRRRVYRLTGRGQQALAAAREEWRAFATTVHSLLEVTP